MCRWQEHPAETTMKNVELVSSVNWRKLKREVRELRKPPTDSETHQSSTKTDVKKNHNVKEEPHQAKPHQQHHLINNFETSGRTH